MVSDPNNLSYLVNHLRELPDDARKYLIWASFFGATYGSSYQCFIHVNNLLLLRLRFKVTEVALMMDWEDSSGSSSDDDNGGGGGEDMWNVSKAVNNIRETALGTAQGSMRGLQTAIQEGWLVQRGRDMCSFAHDRYRQAAQSEAVTMPGSTVQKMSFRVRKQIHIRSSCTSLAHCSTVLV